MPPHVVSAKTTSFPRARIFGLLLGLRQPGSTDGATLSTCCVNDRVSLAWTAVWQFPFAGMTSFGRNGSDHAAAVLQAAFPSSYIPVVAVTAGLVPFLLDPAAALGCHPPWYMKLQYVDLVAAFLLGVSSTVCTRQPSSASTVARIRLPAWSSVRLWLLRIRSGRGSGFPPPRLLGPDPVLHVSTPVRRGVVADSHLGLA